MNKEFSIEVEVPVVSIGPDAESINNKVTEINESSTDKQYPSAKSVWRLFRTFIAKVVRSITSASTDDEIPTAKAVHDTVQSVFSQSIAATSAAASAAVLAEAATNRATTAAADAEDLAEELREDLPVVQDVMERGTDIIDEAGVLLSAIKTCSYTADFRENADTIPVVNLDGDITITDIVVSNVTTLKLTHGAVLQTVVMPGTGLAIKIGAGEVCIWEITRTNESARAFVGVKYIPDRYLRQDAVAQND